MAIILPAAPAATTLLYRWKDPTGTVWSLSGNSSVAVLAGERGLGIPGFDLAEDKLPTSPGSIVRHANTRSREIELPLHCRAASGAALDGLMETVYDRFATGDEAGLTPGYLQVRRQNGTWREIGCLYVSGLEGDLGDGASGETWRDVAVVLKAVSSWAQDIADQVIGGLENNLGNEQSLINRGRLTAYPIWSITGPASGIVITNATTGEVINLTASGGLSVLSGETLTIDTTPPNELSSDQVRLQDGTNLFEYVTSGSKLWGLRRGQTTYVVAAAGTDVNTRVSLRYRPRYRALR